jgi:hypothetical protein
MVSMVLKVVALKCVMKNLKKYWETINANQMEMELWMGIAVFGHLVLLESALPSHDVPLKVKRSTIKHVNLRFP